jgi:hypothetical protein
MNLTFFSAHVPLTKTYEKLPDGTIAKTSYPDVYAVTSHNEDVRNITQFHAAVVEHAEQNHCMVKGELSRSLVQESRAGTTDSTGSTWWICLDIDGLRTKQSIDEILSQLGIIDTSYVLQWSASQDISSSDLRCHIFLMLDKPTPAPFLKQWLIQLNLSTPLLNTSMQLARSGNAIRWGLDITTCQNDKLIFIAAPTLKKIRDPFKNRQRYELVLKKHQLLSLPDTLNSVAVNKTLTEQRKHELRSEAGLPPKKATYRSYKDVEVLSKPDQAIITVDRVGEHFTYVNLNGGNSSAYYHPNSNAEILYNFKGEPNYLIKDLDPDYFKQTLQALRIATKEADEQAKDAEAASHIGVFSALEGPVLLAFRDRLSGVYYHGTYDEKTELLDLAVARNEKQVRDFCMQFNMPIGDFVPIWNITFDPQDTIRVDVANRSINLFQRTEYMRAAPKRIQRCPPTIFKVIRHALGGEEETIEHFMNWCAFIIQRRTRTNTAWVLYGTEGTGKGLLMSKILRPLLGTNQTTIMRAEQLQQQYNTFMKNTLLVFYDEAHIPNMKDSEGVLEKLRNFITEDPISMRAMYANAVEVPNFSNHILASNKPNVITLSSNDRRWNIARFQHEKLSLSHAEFAILDEGSELQDFYHYLYAYAVDEVAVRTPLASEDRQQLINTTISTADEIAEALNERAARMDFFLGLLPTSDLYKAYPLQMNKAEDFKAVLLVLLERTLPDGTCKIARDELRALFDYTAGPVPESPHKFTKFLAHRHIHTKKVRIDRPVQGIEVKWADVKNFASYLKDSFPTNKAEAK